MEKTNSVVGTWVLVSTKFSPTSPYNYFSVLPYSRKPQTTYRSGTTIQEEILSTGTREEMVALCKLIYATYGKD